MELTARRDRDDHRRRARSAATRRARDVVRHRLARRSSRARASSRSSPSATATTSSPTRSPAARTVALVDRPVARARRAPSGAAVVQVDDAFAALGALGRARPRRARPTRRRRHHRLGRQDRHQGSHRRRARAQVRACTPARGRTTTRSGCRSRCSTRRPAPRRWCSRWARAPTATSPRCARSRARPSAWSPTSGSPTPGRSAAAPAWPGSRASCSRRSPPTGLAVLDADDPATPGLAARTVAPRRARRGRGRADADVRAARRRARRRAAPALHARVAVGDGPRRARGPRRAPGRERDAWPPRSRWRTVCRSTTSPPGSPSVQPGAVAHGDAAHADGVVVLNDAYNANPSSMAAALEALGPRRGAGPPHRGARRDARAR